MQPRTLIVIPARMHATRLPGKPLIDIGGEPLIVHVWRRAMAAETGRVVVATDTEEIVAAVRGAGGEAVMTRPDHASGSDRVFEAANRIDPDCDFEIILNVQGDLPAMEPGIVRDCLRPMEEKGADIATIAALIGDPASRTDPNVVKVVGTPTQVPGRLRALYFTRATAPWGEGPLYHHFGMYAYRRSALERFVSLRPSTLEKREQLEQLRALEDGMRIDVTVVDTVPVEVNTPQDLERARRIIPGKGRP
jgi:3-deoxy-manno-octulosonate cytidylyltransferase (CMP-KDO synthetase)